ncbi:hypothetical protein KVT40_000574 [Elsinoe batatas]|uniref:Pentatricopeptide repeat-containing protein n=1 Tax=Elsinoe batatas TaxID=2601811 RepID=A0A8K0LAC4_9PEZI|nr:hypothetical protein KVT40_000574 [Elsinoe batatas]
MSRGDIKGGLILYDHLKAAGPRPNRYTVIHVLKGLGRKPVEKWQIDKALQIFWQDISKDEELKRNAYLSNAVLAVCTSANDLDNAWKIYETMSAVGRGPINDVSYDTLFRALRFDVQRHSRHSRAYLETWQEHVQTADQLWSIVQAKKQTGEITLNSALTIESQPTTAIKILKLVEDVFGIPSTGREPWVPSPLASQSRPEMTRSRHMDVNAAASQLRPHAQAMTVTMHALTALDRNTLGKYRSSRSYYRIFVEGFNIQPTPEAYKAYLVALARERDSKAAIRALQQWHVGCAKSGTQLEPPERKHYKVAILACAGKLRSAKGDERRRGAAMQHVRQIMQLMHDADSPKHAYCWMLYLYMCLFSREATIVYQSLEDLSTHVVGIQKQFDSISESVVPNSDLMGRSFTSYSFASDATELLQLRAAILGVLTNEDFERPLRRKLSGVQFEEVRQWQSESRSWLRDRGLLDQVPHISFESSGTAEAAKIRNEADRYDSATVWKELALWAVHLATGTHNIPDSTPASPKPNAEISI